MNTLAKAYNRKYRHEYKFLIDQKDEVMIKEALKGLLAQDLNVNKEGSYFIRSVYFDDPFDTCFHQNEEGTDPRGKYRIRTYNLEKEGIKLEHKVKKRGMTFKESVPISLSQCQIFLEGKSLKTDMPEWEQLPELLKQFNLLVMTKVLRPKVVVEYERMPYVCKEGNVRLTIDRNIASSGYIEHFFDSDMPKRPIMKTGQHIFEVKYDEFLPGYLKKNLELGHLSQTTFSKYYLCRKYELKGVLGL